LEITNIKIKQIDESGSQNIQCILKSGEKILKSELSTSTKNEKICANSKQKLVESKLTFECDLATKANTQDDNENKNIQKLCVMARIDFDGTTKGKKFILGATKFDLITRTILGLISLYSMFHFIIEYCRIMLIAKNLSEKQITQLNRFDNKD